MADDGDDSTSQSMSPDSVDEERPTKKARYVWQIKGRYRLRHSRGHSCTSSQCGENTSLVVLPVNQECPVHRWQTRQMAKAVVDNTINQVLEDMGFTPLRQDADCLLNNEFPNTENSSTGNLEDEAVLMAIQSHGLRKPCSCSHLPHTSQVHHTPFHHRPSNTISPEQSSSDETNSAETDFLAQAVAVAIQKKGLGSFSQTDHG